MTLQIDALSKRYGGLAAVDDVTLTARAGEVTAVIGPNGAGKTTLINLISGVVAADDGTVQLHGRDLSSCNATHRAMAGLTRSFQSPQLFEGMTVLQTVMVGAHNRARSGFIASMLRGPAVIREEAAIETAALQALETVGVPASIHQRPAHDLAYGLQRRVEIARTVAMDAKAILFDEPAAGLNDQEVDEIADLIQRLQRRGTIIVLVEHRMEMVMRLSQHIVVMNFGTKIAEGTPDEIQRNPAVIAAYLGTEETSDA